MTLVKPKPAGFGSGERLYATQINTLQDELVKAVDGTGGGTYSPTSEIIIDDGNSQGLSVDLLTLTNGNFPLLSSRTITRQISLGYPANNSSSRFSFNNTGLHWYQSSIADFGGLTFAIDRLIDRAVLDKVWVICHGSVHGSPNSDFPATMPSFSVVRSDNTASGTIIGSKTLNAATDFSSTIGNYNAVFAVQVDNAGSSMAETTREDLGTNWWLKITGEASTNATAGFTILSVFTEYTVTELRP